MDIDRVEALNRIESTKIQFTSIYNIFHISGPRNQWMIVSDPFEPHLRHGVDGVDMDGSRSVSPQTGEALDPFNNPVTCRKEKPSFLDDAYEKNMTSCRCPSSMSIETNYA